MNENEVVVVVDDKYSAIFYLFFSFFIFFHLFNLVNN